MMRSVLADAGPLYAAVDEGDEHHFEARRQLDMLERERRDILIAYPILLEGYSLVLYRLGIAAAHKWIAFFAGAFFINPDSQDYGRALTTVQSFPDQRITLVDATIAALAVRHGLEVWTYDHHFDMMRVPVWR
ncbi:MAG TPA: PIN domain-containing protein [Candidatus Aquilonibacter sp.]|nr:PIN domain-containing protein [Candidatus Aquilonibacter sp.]